MIENYKNIVIKIGSNLLVGSDGLLREKWLDNICNVIAELKSNGKNIVIVSSGAIALGRNNLFALKDNLKLEEKQAAAAVGQIELTKSYSQSLARHDITVAQILLTLEDSDDRRRYLNARRTIASLLDANAVPVINENDTVTTEEIRIGDNDRLAARVAEMMGADLLVLLSDIDGLYDSDPNINKDAKHIPLVEDLNPEILGMAGDSASKYGTGGMKTKITAAIIADKSGCDTIIASGMADNALDSLINGDAKHTLIKSKLTPASARKRWISSTLNLSGVVIIDNGAVTALESGNSLLAVGTIKAEGTFDRGDVIAIYNEDGKEIARGLSHFSVDEVQRIIGKRNNEIENILGYDGRVELVHKNDLVILDL